MLTLDAADPVTALPGCGVRPSHAAGRTMADLVQRTRRFISAAALQTAISAPQAPGIATGCRWRGPDASRSRV